MIHALTSAVSCGSSLTDVRCICGRLQFRMEGAMEGLYIQRKCDRCKRLVEVMGGETVIASYSSPNRAIAY